MNLPDIARIRLSSQQLIGTKHKKVKDLVAWMGAMQAQDYNMAKWAIGVRLANSTDKTIQTAIDKGEILRTHILRPTWHFVAAEDIYWMLQLTAPRILASIKPRDKTLELTESIYKKSFDIIAKALQDNRHVIREELVTQFEKAKISMDQYRASHIMLRAELEGMVCSGVMCGKKQTYALLEDRITKSTFTKEEALAKLARKYFTSHCPATLQDFVWWSGLTTTDARHGMDLVKKDFVVEKIGAESYWISNSFSGIKQPQSTFHLLPAFDEFIISYRNRSAALDLKHHSKAISNNGIFRPVIIENGQVIGLWKKVTAKNKIVVAPNFFIKPNELVLEQLEKASSRLRDF